MAGKLNVLKAFNCPSCGASQQLRASGFTTTYVCTSCGVTIDTSGEKYAVLRAASQNNLCSTYQLLPLGLRGTFSDGEFEIIGFMVRSSQCGMYYWSEYLLFNPYKGFRWLMEMDDHWNFVRMVKERPGSAGDSTIRYSGMKFKRFLRDAPRVRAVVGEFYWQVKVEDTVNSVDYIAPPFGLSCEVDDDEIVWSTLEYLTSREVREAFNLDSPLPGSSGISPTQPNPCRYTGSYVAIGSAMLAVLIFFKVVLLSKNHQTVVVPQTSYAHSTTDTDKVKRTEVFDIPEYGNLKVSVDAPVNNNWISVDVDLVNAQTQETTSRAVEVSYYHGVDSDGSWSEGSTREHEIFGAVPPGSYFLALEASSDSTLPAINYTVKASYNVAYFGNFAAAFFLILAIPVLVFARSIHFESRRWQDSDQG